MKKITFDTYEGGDIDGKVVNTFTVDEQNLMDTISHEYNGKSFGTFIKKQIENQRGYYDLDARNATISGVKCLLNLLTTQESTMFEETELDVIKLAKKIITRVENYI